MTTTIPKAEMDRKFRDGGWEQKLLDVPPNRRQPVEDKQWPPAPGRTVLRKKGIKYVAEDQSLLALVITYGLSDGTTRTSVRALTEDDTTFVVE